MNKATTAPSSGADVRYLRTMAIAWFIAGSFGLWATNANAISLERAQGDCMVAVAEHKADTSACDRLIEMAHSANDVQGLVIGYLYRSFQRERADDLSGAMADVDQALAAFPTFNTSNWQRAKLIGEQGDYDGALKRFAELPVPEPVDDYDTALAMLQYVAGDPAKAVSLFRSAAEYAAKEDRKLAAYYRFNAAIIESELKGGDLAPIVAADTEKTQGTLVVSLGRHRLGRMTDAELEALIPEMKDAPGMLASATFPLDIATL